MGNHDVGRAFNAAFKAIDKKIDTMPIQELVEFLDAIGNEYRNTDAEFDDYCEPSTPLGRAITRVFNPDIPPMPSDINSDEYYKLAEVWYDTVYTPFRNRFEMC